MKHLFPLCLLAALAFCATANAKPISRDQAKQRAEAFMQQRNDKMVLTAVTGKRHLSPGTGATQGGNEHYYVFNRGLGQGFVIVSGDDQTEEVLGYSDQGTFDYPTLPPALQTLLDDYDRQIKALQDAPDPAAIILTDAVSTHPAVPQLLDCTWNQGDPYNQSCPMYFTLGRSVTGCVATAMAQILYYHRDKSVTETQATIPAYDTWTSHATYGRLHVNEVPSGSPIDWDNMLPSYGNATALQKKAVADLMLYCGTSVHMDYTNSSSGAQSSEVATALPRYFGYGSSVREVYADSYSDAEWDNIIYNEVANSRPVYLSGANASAGHAFVCDGYDGNKRYHINWGWGGASNGYYLLTNLTPGSQGIGGSDSGYNSYRDAIIGIEPVNFAGKAMNLSDATVRTVCLDNFDTDGDGSLTYGEAAAVTDLGDAFKQKAIKAFPELYYFTGLEAIADDAFNGCTQLTSIKLPKSIKAIGNRSFKQCQKLTAVTLPEGVSQLGEEAFEGCAALASLKLPQAMTAVEAGTLKGCSKLTAIDLPVSVVSIGDNAFSGCTSLKTFVVNSVQPEAITVGSGIFADCRLANATLEVQQGCRDFFSQTEPWKDFGNIHETRNLAGGTPATLTSGNTYFLYHVGTGRFLTKGEAWSTQAIVGSQPMRFVIKHSSILPEDVYYVTSEDTGKSGRYLFRTTTDNNIGNGVKAAFVDGTSATTSARWLIKDLGGNIYTIQTPTTDANYKEGEYWGVETSHASNAAQPTYGIYGDIVYQGNEKNCQWRLVEYNEETYATYQAAQTLGNLLQMAASRNIDASEAQAVYDDMNASVEQLRAAQTTLRTALKLVDFAEDAAREIAINNWDLNIDGELSYEEAAMVSDLGTLFSGTAITSLDELQHFTSVTELYGNSFLNCTSLESIQLPPSIETLYYRVFYNCKKLKSISLPAYVTYIGENTFYGCTSLTSVTMANPDPASVSLGNNVFSGVNLGNCTLYVPKGAKSLYAQAEVWKGFGNIVEVRMATSPRLSAPTVDKPGYIYNVATRKYINKGEAWGTQAVVSRSGLSYQFKRSTTMPEGIYYLQANLGSTTNNTLFRTDTDNKVGEGVKACYVDGALSTKGYWEIKMVGDSLFTIQTPSTDATHVDGQYLGTQSDHQSAVASPTNGIYWDVTIADHEKNCLWSFVTEEDIEAAHAFDQLVADLNTLLQKARQKEIDTTEEQAVYDNLDATEEQITDAIASLRQKMHFINFTDQAVRTVSIAQWDTDGDNELTDEEAANITDIGKTFSGNTAIKTLEDLRHFTSLTQIPAEAFKSCSNLETVYVPEQVASFGNYVFQFCNSMKYIVMLGKETVVDNVTFSLLPSKATVFVQPQMMQAYQESSAWQGYRTTEFTGIPVVTADDVTRLYGRRVSKLTYTLTGAPINGEPVVEQPLVQDMTTPVGEYDIPVTPGTITTPGLQCVSGTLFVEPAELKVTAKSYTREYGQENPTFELTYSGFRNRETVDVLTQQPVATCDATPTSPVGTYDIVVSGGVADNYAFTYIAGTLTVTEATAIRNITADGQQQTLYDLQGRRLNPEFANSHHKKGIYVTKSKKLVSK